MKNFLIYIIKYLVIFLILVYSVEFLFTYSYYHFKYPRNKMCWIKNEQQQGTFDYAVFGSSRCIHHINPQIVKQQKNIKGINLGYAACHPFEIKLIVFEFFKTNHVDKIFIQIDYTYNDIKPSSLAKVQWLPFIKEDNICNEFSKYDKETLKLANIPFYRYMINDSKIGFREIFMGFYGGQPKWINTVGYSPIDKIMKNPKSLDYTLIDNENIHLRELQEFCKKRGIECYFFTAPYYKSNNNNEIMGKYLKNYKDLSTTISDSLSFSDNTHLNHKGATEFSIIFANEYFK